MSKRFLPLTLLFVVALIPAPTPAAETTAQDTVTCRQARLLGPLPTGPEVPENELPRGTQRVVPEIESERGLPVAESDGWRDITADDEGRFQVTEPGVYWIASRLRTTRFTQANLMLQRGSALYSEGERLGRQDPGQTADPLSAATTLTRGWITVIGRVIIADDDLSFSLQAAADSVAAPRWTLATATALTRFTDTDQVAAIGSLAVADGGKLIARYLSRRSDSHNPLDLLDAEGHVVAADIGGGKMRPVGFLPDGTRLLLRRGGDLVLWDAPGGEMRTILADEPGLDFVKISPDGRALLFASTKGFEADEPGDGPGRRYIHFRERVSDYTPAAHLHWLDLTTGVRRILTRPGDFVLDDAVFSADGKSVFYGRTLPQAPRPWFSSEIRRLDLATGTDELITGFTSGWEVRPQAFAPSPDGRQLAFIGPPAEIKPDAILHNVYNMQVWLLDLQNGSYRRITQEETFAFAGGSGFPVFTDANQLLVRINDRSTRGVAKLTRDKSGWRAQALPHQGASLGDVALSPDHRHLAYTTSSPAQPSELYVARVGKSGRLLAAPNAVLGTRTLWAETRDMTFVGPGGESIESWYFPPLQMKTDGDVSWQDPAGGRFPLIVYYYGGAAPTLRSFNTTFQFLAANGYGVLVVNPRGATGYGDAFADRHAGDWGPDAAADIMAATENVLAAHEYLDRGAMGIYGGSYGGFMTDYLVTHTDLYAAAVSMYGISDLTTYFGQGAWGVTYGDMALGGRSPWADPQYFTEHSPVFQVDQVKTPLLLLHGLADTNVTTGESIQLFTELSVLDKPVEMVLFPGEEHGISGSWTNRTAHRTMLLEWFDRWLKNQPEAWKNRWAQD